jgi:hypothetical protein
MAKNEILPVFFNKFLFGEIVRFLTYPEILIIRLNFPMLSNSLPLRSIFTLAMRTASVSLHVFIDESFFKRIHQHISNHLFKNLYDLTERG